MGNEIVDDREADDGAQRARHELNELVRVVGDDVGFERHGLRNDRKRVARDAWRAVGVLHAKEGGSQGAPGSPTSPAQAGRPSSLAGPTRSVEWARCGPGTTRRERGARVTGPRRGSRLASHIITRSLIPEDYGATVLSHNSDV